MVIAVMPDAALVVKNYLSSIIPLTAIVHARIRVNVTDTTWPSIRITELTATEQVERRLERSLIQVDCWAPPADKDIPNSGPGTARTMASLVWGAFREIANYEYLTWAVAGGADGIGMRYQPDESRDPAIPRYVVTAGVYVRPNP